MRRRPTSAPGQTRSRCAYLVVRTWKTPEHASGEPQRPPRATKAHRGCERISLRPDLRATPPSQRRLAKVNIESSADQESSKQRRASSYAHELPRPRKHQFGREIWFDHGKLSCDGI